MKIGIDGSRAFVDEPTGTERYAYEMIRHLLALPEAENHEWIIYVRRGQRSRMERDGGYAKARVVEIPLRYLWTQVGLAARTWVDGLDCLWIPAHTLPVLRKPGLKTAVTVHGLEYEFLPAYENALQRWYLPLSTQYAVRQADKVIAVSEFTKSQVVERLNARPDKVDVVYEGVAEGETGKGSETAGVLKDRGLEPKKYIMFIGTIQPRKNLVRLIKAVSELTGKGMGLKLVICGKWGWMYGEVVAAPNNFGVGDRIVFTGYTNDAERQLLLQNALVYVQPSVTEGFGLPVVEAMRSGVPVVISKGGALPELVDRPWPMFDPYSVEDMKRVLGQVIERSDLRLDMIQRGRRKAKEFNWKNSARKTYNILTHLS